MLKPILPQILQLPQLLHLAKIPLEYGIIPVEKDAQVVRELLVIAVLVALSWHITKPTINKTYVIAPF